jgi:hypothetical protein
MPLRPIQALGRASSTTQGSASRTSLQRNTSRTAPRRSRQDGARGRKVLKTKAELDLLKDTTRRPSWSFQWRASFRCLRRSQSREKETSTAGINDTPVQPELQQVLLYTTFIPLALKGDGTSALYRLIHAGGKLFEIDEVDEDNFIEFKPLRRPHSQFGNNFAKRIVSTQNARTVLTRGILDHTATTTNPRWQVLNNTLDEPQGASGQQTCAASST